jgi:hypothetical protein
MLHAQAFGIYHPPLRLLPTIQQELGLSTLAIRALCDFELICADGARLPCSRNLLESRWPWFAASLAAFRARARATPTFEAASEVRLTPRELLLPEAADVAVGALQYFYTLTLCTPLQHKLGTLVGLLVFSRTYDVPNLRALVVHALHCQLGTGGAPATGTTTAQIYEAATLSGALALQIRSLKTLMQASRSSRSRESAAAAAAGEPRAMPGRPAVVEV